MSEANTAKSDPWSTMDSAPMDGTVIWVIVNGKPMIAFHQTNWNWKRFRVDRMWQVLWHEGEDELGAAPSSWMPLPEPPENKALAAE